MHTKPFALLVASAALVLQACEPAAPPEVPKPAPQTSPPSLVPFLVDHPKGAAPFEVGMRRGAVVVAYDAAGLRVLGDCTADASYTFSGSAPEPVRKVFSGALRAELPSAGRELEERVGPELARGALLVLEAALTGTYTLGRVPARGELHGTCAGATHVVVSATVGAFVLGLDRTSVRASLVGPVGAGAVPDRPFQTLTSGGERPACESATPASTSPPRRCDSLVRIALDPLDP